MKTPLTKWLSWEPEKETCVSYVSDLTKVVFVTPTDTARTFGHIEDTLKTGSIVLLQVNGLDQALVIVGNTDAAAHARAVYVDNAIYTWHEFNLLRGLKLKPAELFMINTAKRVFNASIKKVSPIKKHKSESEPGVRDET